MWSQRESGLSVKTSDYGNCLDVSYTRPDGKYITQRIEKHHSAASVAYSLLRLAEFIEDSDPVAEPEGG